MEYTQMYQMHSLGLSSFHSSSRPSACSTKLPTLRPILRPIMLGSQPSAADKTWNLCVFPLPSDSGEVLSYRKRNLDCLTAQPSNLTQKCQNGNSPQSLLRPVGNWSGREPVDKFALHPLLPWIIWEQGAPTRPDSRPLVAGRPPVYFCEQWIAQSCTTFSLLYPSPFSVTVTALRLDSQ